jgi:hypothetical protein
MDAGDHQSGHPGVALIANPADASRPAVPITAPKDSSWREPERYRPVNHIGTTMPRSNAQTAMAIIVANATSMT